MNGLKMWHRILTLVALRLITGLLSSLISTLVFLNLLWVLRISLVVLLLALLALVLVLVLTLTFIALVLILLSFVRVLLFGLIIAFIFGLTTRSQLSIHSPR